jgi:carbamoyltransferase
MIILGLNGWGRRRAWQLPYMVVTVPIVDAWLERLQGVAQVDGTARPQSVLAEADPLYARLLYEISNQTGVSAVLNTSLNGEGEPLVETSAQALSDFVLNCLDALAIGPYLLRAR